MWKNDAFIDFFFFISRRRVAISILSLNQSIACDKYIVVGVLARTKQNVSRLAIARVREKEKGEREKATCRIGLAVCVSRRRSRVCLEAFQYLPALDEHTRSTAWFTPSWSCWSFYKTLIRCRVANFNRDKNLYFSVITPLRSGNIFWNGAKWIKIASHQFSRIAITEKEKKKKRVSRGYQRVDSINIKGLALNDLKIFCGISVYKRDFFLLPTWFKDSLV